MLMTVSIVGGTAASAFSSSMATTAVSIFGACVSDCVNVGGVISAGGVIGFGAAGAAQVVSLLATFLLATLSSLPLFVALLSASIRSIIASI